MHFEYEDKANLKNEKKIPNSVSGTNNIQVGKPKPKFHGNEKGQNCFFEWFNNIKIPQDEVQDYYVIYIYKNPVNSIFSKEISSNVFCCDFS